MKIQLTMFALLTAIAVAGADKEWTVRGKVVDADTGEPIPRFGVFDGEKFRSIVNVMWNLPATNARKGGFLHRMKFDERAAPVIAVEAAGYAPQARTVTRDAQAFQFRLERHRGYSGMVRTPRGLAAARAKVYLLTGHSGVVYDDDDLVIEVERHSPPGLVEFCATDREGRFQFPPKLDPKAVVVLHESGYGELPIEQLQLKSELTLRPWGRIEGRVMVGNQPSTNDVVRLNRPGNGWIYYPYKYPFLWSRRIARSDSDGRFVFERIPPLDCRLFVHATQDQFLQVKPGETKHAQLGGTGRPVVGRVQLEGHEGEFDWVGERVEIHRVLPEHPKYASRKTFDRIREEFHLRFANAETEEERIAAFKFREQRREDLKVATGRFYQTKEGRLHYFQHKRIAVNFDAAGRFRVEDVPAGVYQLEMDFGKRKEGPYGALDVTFEVPETKGYSAEPFDVGEFTVTMKRRLRLEDLTTAPDFSFETFDGRELRLSSFRGKFVLLDFWALWCGPCLGETPHLKKAWAEFKDDERFAMIGLSLDAAKKAPSIYAKKHELGWIQGWLGRGSDTNVPERYGIQGIPCIMLIGPTGRILFTKLRGEEIADAIRDALKAK